MKVKRFEWEGAVATAKRVRSWDEEESLEWIDAKITEIEREVRGGGDAAVLRLTARFDATETPSPSLQVDRAEAGKALAALDPTVREALDVAAANVRAVAEEQLEIGVREVELRQGQTVRIREVPVGAAGIYAPGGRAAYPSSVLMCAIPARVAGVKRIALASPPGPDGRLNPLVLAAAELCGVDEIYAMGGAQAIFALALGTETVERVDVVAGPGNTWVQEAKRKMWGIVGLDSYAGPSELMVVAGPETNPNWAALDLCAQAEHGESSPLLVVAVDEAVLEGIGAAAESVAAARSGVSDSPLALVRVPDLDAAIDLANAFVPEHLELLVEDAGELAQRVTTAGCVFAGPHGATAFGDYVAGSNHVLPTIGAGRFAGPLGPGVFRRKMATVEIPAAAAAKLAPHVDALARAEGLPVHGESAMIRRKENA
jgi:histidinol dehydrogenase